MGKSSRLPVNICFAIDRSSSMKGKNLNYTKQALANAVTLLRREDIVSIVTYDNEVKKLVLRPTKSYQKDEIIDAVNRITACGGNQLERRTPVCL